MLNGLLQWVKTGQKPIWLKLPVDRPDISLDELAKELFKDETEWHNHLTNAAIDAEVDGDILRLRRLVDAGADRDRLTFGLLDEGSWMTSLPKVNENTCYAVVDFPYIDMSRDTGAYCDRVQVLIPEDHPLLTFLDLNGLSEVIVRWDAWNKDRYLECDGTLPWPKDDARVRLLQLMATMVSSKVGFATGDLTSIPRGTTVRFAAKTYTLVSSWHYDSLAKDDPLINAIGRLTREQCIALGRRLLSYTVSLGCFNYKEIVNIKNTY